MPDEKLAKMPIIFVLGGPGSGKATVCLRLEKDFNLTNVNAGGLLRAAVASNSPKGKEIADAMKNGQLVSNDIVLGVISDYMHSHADNVKGFLVVGYPREVPQAEAFEQAIGPVKSVIYLHATNETRTARLLKAHAHEDDNEETIKKRLAAYSAHSEAVVKHFGALCHHVDANVGEEEVYQASKKYVEEVLKA